jgi:hypothetical protein
MVQGRSVLFLGSLPLAYLRERQRTQENNIEQY